MDFSQSQKLQITYFKLLRLPSLFTLVLRCCFLFVVVDVNANALEETAPLTKAQLFERAFGVKQPEYYELEQLLVLINGEASISAEFEVNPLTSDIKIKKALIADVVLGAAKKGIDLSLHNYSQPDGYLDLQKMRENGFSITVSRRRQVVDIQLPLAARKRQSMSGSGNNFGNNRLTEPRANTSGYINLYNYNTYNEDDTVGQQYQSVSVFETNLQRGQLNFQYESNYTNISTRDKSWVSSAARIIYAEPEESRHFIFGEQTPLNTNWQLNPSPLARGFDERLVGTGVNKRAQLTDFANVSNSFFYDFDLDEPAEIQVFVNGDLTYQKKLTTGVYKLKDLQLDDGSNDIRIVILKESGAVEEFSDRYFQSFDILEAGEFEYQISSGYLYEDQRDLSKLDTDNATSLLYLRYGVSQQYTLGSYLQFQNNRQVGGMIMQTSNSLGLWSLDVSTASDDIVGNDYATRLELVSNAIYAPFGFYDETFYSYGFALESYGENYISDTSAITPTDYINEIDWLFQPVLEWGFNRNMRVSASASYRKFRDQRGNDKSYNINYNHRWREFDFQVKYERKSKQQFEKRHQLLFVVTWNGDQGRNYIRAETNTDLDTQNVTASFRPVDSAKQRYELTSFYEDSQNYRHSGEFSYRDGYTNRSLEYQQIERNNIVTKNVNGVLEGHRGAIRARTSRSDNVDDTHLVVLEGAIAFADGHFALSQPIEDSFAIVYPGDSLADSVTTLSRNAQIDKFGPAVISDINAYQVQRIQVEDTDAPIGVDFGSSLFYIDPTYGSGTAVEIGDGGTLLVTGTLLDDKGEPLSLKTGYLTPTLNVDKRLFFFTNRQGEFSLLGVEEGSYQLVLDSTSLESAVLELTEKGSDQGLILLGDIMIGPKDKNDE
jgi:outer membrane usher protein